MGVRFNVLVCMAALTGAMTAELSRAVAQPQPANLVPLNQRSIPEVLDQAVNRSTGDFFKNQSIEQDAVFTFGINYDERRFAKDAQRIDALYRDLLQQQVASDPIIRTQDLPTPYTTSLRLSGEILSDTPVSE